MKKINTVQDLINELMLVDDKGAEINIILNENGYERLIPGQDDNIQSARIVGFKRGAEWQAKQSWISVEDRLPEDHGKVLVRVVSGSIDSKISYTLAWMTNKRRFNIEMDWVKVTHWIPIPSFDEILESNKDVLQRIKESD